MCQSNFGIVITHASLSCYRTNHNVTLRCASYQGWPLRGLGFTVTIVCIHSVPVPDSLILTSSKPGPIWPVGSDVSLACIVKLNPTVVESDLPQLMVDVQLSRDGTPLALASPTINGMTFIYTTQLNLFGRSDSGNYTCTATVRPQPTVTYLVVDHSLTVSIIISTGMLFLY